MKRQFVLISAILVVCSPVAFSDFFVIDESYAFNEPLPITLVNLDIVIDSILVTDNSGLEIYTLGDDYLISQHNRITELNVTTLGIDLPNINDGQELLVDYTYIPEPATLLLLSLGVPILSGLRKRKL